MKVIRAEYENAQCSLLIDKDLFRAGVIQREDITQCIVPIPKIYEDAMEQYEVCIATVQPKGCGRVRLAGVEELTFKVMNYKAFTDHKGLLYKALWREASTAFPEHHFLLNTGSSILKVSTTRSAKALVDVAAVTFQNRPEYQCILEDMLNPEGTV